MRTLNICLLIIGMFFLSFSNNNLGDKIFVGHVIDLENGYTVCHYMAIKAQSLEQAKRVFNNSIMRQFKPGSNLWCYRVIQMNDSVSRGYKSAPVYLPEDCEKIR